MRISSVVEQLLASQEGLCIQELVGFCYYIIIPKTIKFYCVFMYSELRMSKIKIIITFFFLVSWGWLSLIPLGIAATVWPIVRAPDER
jgi:hypothetical protein